MFSALKNIVLRLNSQVGLFLHPDDKVEDVISAGDIIFIILTESSRAENSSQDLLAEPSTNRHRFINNFQLRIITPRLAYFHEDIRTIPPLEDGKFFSEHLTMRDLRASIAKSLNIVLEDGKSQTQECNSKIAELISDTPHASLEGSLKIIIVSDLSNVAQVNVREPTFGSIMTGVKEFLGGNFEDVKSTYLKGGRQTKDDKFTRLPVVSICAKSHHSHMHQTETVSFSATSVLDLHTAEGPIKTSCLDFSMEKLRLTDLVVNGVLSIYVVERRANSTAPETLILGKDATYSAAKHWVRQ